MNEVTCTPEKHVRIRNEFDELVIEISALEEFACRVEEGLCDPPVCDAQRECPSLLETLDSLPQDIAGLINRLSETRLKLEKALF